MILNSCLTQNLKYGSNMITTEIIQCSAEHHSIRPKSQDQGNRAMVEPTAAVSELVWQTAQILFSPKNVSSTCLNVASTGTVAVKGKQKHTEGLGLDYAPCVNPMVASKW